MAKKRAVTDGMNAEQMLDYVAQLAQDIGREGTSIKSGLVRLAVNMQRQPTEKEIKHFVTHWIIGLGSI